jgi:hypothetical protein
MASLYYNSISLANIEKAPMPQAPGLPKDSDLRLYLDVLDNHESV